jgi:hypothetical protein
METGKGPGETRALVAIAPSGSREPERARGQRPEAAFLAHLIATARQAPQTRCRRRSEPGQAIAAYVLRMEALPRNGSAVARSM